MCNPEYLHTHYDTIKKSTHLLDAHNSYPLSYLTQLYLWFIILLNWFSSLLNQFKNHIFLTYMVLPKLFRLSFKLGNLLKIPNLMHVVLFCSCYISNMAAEQLISWHCVQHNHFQEVKSTICWWQSVSL